MIKKFVRTGSAFFFVIGSVSSIMSCTGGDWNPFESNFVGSVAETKDATNITENSATLNGSVQPNDEAVEVCFLLSDNVDTLLYNSLSLIYIQANPRTFAPSNKWMATSAKVTDLKPKTTYYFTIEILTDRSIFGYKSFTTL